MARSRELLARSSDPLAAPADWQARWDQPLDWPGVKPAKQAKKTKLPALDFTDAALVVVDMDKKSLDMQIQAMNFKDKPAARVMTKRVYGVALPNIIRLIELFRTRQRPVIFVQWGWHRYQYPPLEPRPGEEVIVKRGRGAFGTSSLDAALRQKHVRTLCVAGTCTHLCVESTVRGAVDYGYSVVLVEDACIASDPKAHERSIQTLSEGTARIASTAQVKRGR